MTELQKVELQRVVAHAASCNPHLSKNDCWAYVRSRELLRTQPEHHAAEAARDIIADFSAALTSGKPLQDSFSEFFLPSDIGGY